MQGGKIIVSLKCKGREVEAKVSQHYIPTHAATFASSKNFRFLRTWSSFIRRQLIVLYLPFLQALRFVYRQRSVGKLSAADVAEDELRLSRLPNSSSTSVMTKAGLCLLRPV
jgi:hypothetical protein